MNDKPIILTSKILIAPNHKAAFADWQAELNAAIAIFPGLVSLEILSPIDLVRMEWLIIQRFKTHEEMINWKNSDIRRKLIESLFPLLLKKDDALQEAESGVSPTQSGITEVIIAEVDPAQDTAFRKWIARIHQVEATFPGFRGTYIQSPSKGQGKNWVTLLQFDTLANLENWLMSKERSDLLQESASMITSLESHRVISSYAGWFSSLSKEGKVPPTWKQTMVVLLVLFPIVALELKYLSPLLIGTNLALSTFIGNALSVTLLAWPVMPVAIYFLRWWLLPKLNSPKHIDLAGTALVAGIYLLEILIFWNFL